MLGKGDRIVVEIDVEREKTKYQAELDTFVKQLGLLESQRATLIQAIHERQGIIAFLDSVNHPKLESK